MIWWTGFGWARLEESYGTLLQIPRSDGRIPTSTRLVHFHSATQFVEPIFSRSYLWRVLGDLIDIILLFPFP